MAQDFVQLYLPQSSPECAYLLENGSVFFYISENDKYAIKGKNLIIGTTELIMNHMLSNETGRVETAVTRDCKTIKKISRDKFISGMESYSFILNVSMVLAKQVLLTNQIINKNLGMLQGDEKKTKESSIQFYKILRRLKDEFDKRKLPWLKELTSKYETSLTYKRGEAYFKSSEPVKISEATDLSDRQTEYPRGTVICEENTYGEEMYRLQIGAIDVVIQGNSVATIEEPGTVSGEMALLLGQKRSASLIAKNNVVLSKITKKDLKEIAEKQTDLLKTIAYALASRHYYNTVKIETINKSLIEQTLDKAEKGGEQIAEKAMNELTRLKNDVEDIIYKKNADFLQDLKEIL